jgi:hypothetical protein
MKVTQYIREIERFGGSIIAMANLSDVVTKRGTLAAVRV